MGKLVGIIIAVVVVLAALITLVIFLLPDPKLESLDQFQS